MVHFDSTRVVHFESTGDKFGTATLDHDNLKAIAVTLKPSVSAYRTKHKDAAREQLRKGGVHLAQLLNAIKWDETR